MSRPTRRPAARHSTLEFRQRYLVRRSSLSPHAMSARKAWVQAVRAREAMQSRIVHAFRRDIAGAGSGPTDLDLQLFARLAVAERRLKRGLGRARVLWPCASVPTPFNRTAMPDRGERQ